MEFNQKDLNNALKNASLIFISVWAFFWLWDTFTSSIIPTAIIIFAKNFIFFKYGFFPGYILFIFMCVAIYFLNGFFIELEYSKYKRRNIFIILALLLSSLPVLTTPCQDMGCLIWPGVLAGWILAIILLPILFITPIQIGIEKLISSLQNKEKIIISLKRIMICLIILYFLLSPVTYILANLKGNCSPERYENKDFYQNAIDLNDAILRSNGLSARIRLSSDIYYQVDNKTISLKDLNVAITDRCLSEAVRVSILKDIYSRRLKYSAQEIDQILQGTQKSTLHYWTDKKLEAESYIYKLSHY